MAVLLKYGTAEEQDAARSAVFGGRNPPFSQQFNNMNRPLRRGLFLPM